MSCFRGRMKEYKNISLDRFDGDNLKSTVFFLSHIHEDHTVGLKDSAIFECLQSRKDVFIYCSAITRLLLLEKSKYSHLDQHVKVLPIDVPTSIPIPQQGSCKIDSVTVTLLHAAHCPGSVMFLFEGNEGNCLYTGDFRWDSQQINTIKALHGKDNSIKKIDSLYIDTTFCHESSIYIPSREDSANATSSLVSEWIAKGPNYVVHFTPRAQYGHEHLLKEVYLKTGHKVHVFNEKYEIYKKIPGLEDVFTDEATSTPVHACKGKWCSTKVPCGHHSDDCRVMVILPSTMYFTMKKNYDLGHIVMKNGFVHRVCYSFHSSYTEVKDFVTYLQPKVARPNVKPALDQTILKVQGRLNEFLKLKNGKAIIDSQKVKPLGRLRRSKFKRRLLSENSSESQDLNFGTPEKEYFPPTKRVKVEVQTDSEDDHSSYDGSVRNDSELSDLSETDEQSRPQSLSLPGQSLLAALDEQEFMMSQGSQPEILGSRVCLLDDEEQVSAVVVPTNTLQSVEYEMHEGESGARGDNSDFSSGFLSLRDHGDVLEPAKVKGCETLSSPGDSLITAAEEAEKEIAYSIKMAAQIGFKNKFSAQDDEIEIHIKEENVRVKDNAVTNCSHLETNRDQCLQNLREGTNDELNCQNDEVKENQFIENDQGRQLSSDDKSKIELKMEQESNFIELQDSQMSEGDEDAIVINSSCSTVCESLLSEVNIDQSEINITIESQASKCIKGQTAFKETSGSFDLLILDDSTSNDETKVKGNDLEVNGRRRDSPSTECFGDIDSKIHVKNSDCGEMLVQEKKNVACRLDKSVVKVERPRENGGKNVSYDLFGTDDEDTIESDDDDVIISDVNHESEGNRELSATKETPLDVLTTARTSLTKILNKSCSKKQNTTDESKSVSENCRNVSCDSGTNTLLNSCNRNLNSKQSDRKPFAIQSMSKESVNNNQNVDCVILDSDDEEERSLLSGKKSLSRASSFTNNDYFDENEPSNLKTFVDNVMKKTVFKLLSNGQCRDTAINCDDYSDSDDETLPPSQHSDASFITMSPFTTPVKLIHGSPSSSRAVDSMSCQRSESRSPGLKSRLRSKGLPPVKKNVKSKGLPKILQFLAPRQKKGQDSQDMYIVGNSDSENCADEDDTTESIMMNLTSSNGSGDGIADDSVLSDKEILNFLYID